MHYVEAGAGAGAFADASSLAADSTNSIFQEGDPLMLSTDGDDKSLDDMNFDSAFVASDDFGAGQDYSFFDRRV